VFYIRYIGPPQGQAPLGGGAPPDAGRAPSKKLQRAMAACSRYAPAPPGGTAPSGAPPFGGSSS
jgi:hypothetical protein